MLLKVSIKQLEDWTYCPRPVSLVYTYCQTACIHHISVVWLRHIDDAVTTIIYYKAGGYFEHCGKAAVVFSLCFCHGTEVSYESLTIASLDRITVYFIGGPFKATWSVRGFLFLLQNHINGYKL